MLGSRPSRGTLKLSVVLADFHTRALTHKLLDIPTVMASTLRNRNVFCPVRFGMFWGSCKMTCVHIRS